jgi:thiol-disulfide isomerase/thioredoxin
LDVYDLNSIIIKLIFKNYFMSKCNTLFIFSFILLNFCSMESTMSKSLNSSTDSLEPIKILNCKNGMKVPVYAFDLFNKKVLTIEDSTVRVINFWATWCKPCVEELPVFFELEQKLKNKNVEFVFVSLDFTKQLEKTLVPFLDKNDIRSKVLVLDQKNANEWMDKINPDWSGAIPATLILNIKERLFHEGKFETASELEKIILPFINN